jgi:hypothetical protein
VKTLRQLHEERRAVDEATRLVESLSSDDKAKAKELVKKINALKVAFGDNSVVSSACKKALVDINEFLGGGLSAFLKKAGSKALRKITGTDELSQNPFVKAAVFLNCMERGLSDTFEVMEDNLDTFKKIGRSFVDQLDKFEKNEARAIASRTHKALTQAFSPDTFFRRVASLVGGKGVIPYVDDVNALTASIMKMSAFDLAKIVKVSQASEVSQKSVDLVRDVASKKDEPKTVDVITALSKKMGIDDLDKAKTTLVSKVAADSGVDKDVVNTVLDTLNKIPSVVTVESIIKESTSDDVAKTLRSSEKMLKVMAKKMGVDPELIAKAAELDDDKFEKFVDMVVSRYPGEAKKIADKSSSDDSSDWDTLAKKIAKSRDISVDDVSSSLKSLRKLGLRMKSKQS